MNAAMFRRIADQIEREPERYYQGCYGYSCDSPHCIAGWAVVLSGRLPAMSRDAWGDAADILGLSDGDANTLFYSRWLPIDGLTVPAALRQIADGASVASVSR